MEHGGAGNWYQSSYAGNNLNGLYGGPEHLSTEYMWWGNVLKQCMLKSTKMMLRAIDDL